MSQSFHVGQRISFKSALCTVRYVGSVEGTDKEWLGVEWDDPKRGKHNGENNGKKYFKCLSSSLTAASFVAINRKADKEQSFVDAVREKYATDETYLPLVFSLNTAIEISGKTVEEVGFDKIKKQQSQLNELKIVLVDGYRINKATSKCAIKDVCPRIVEVDLSRNLFEGYSEIVNICRELDYLKSLRLNGNRLTLRPGDLENATEAFQKITSLEIDETLLSWEDVCLLVPKFWDLATLTLSSNNLHSISSPLPISTLTSLTMEWNQFTSMSDLRPLTKLASLESLHLKGNQISKAGTARLVFGKKLNYVDLSYNQVSTWEFVDTLADVFPGMTALRFAHNPIYEHLAREFGTVVGVDDSYMFTLARLRNLKSLNFSSISDEERRDAEMFYLSRIGQAMAKVSAEEEMTVTSQHKRYAELCHMYGEPTVVRKPADAVNPDFLEARLIKFTFYKPSNKDETGNHGDAIMIAKEIPKGFDVYQVKGIVGRLFGLRPLSLRLIWETGEWDPVAGYEEEEEDYSDEDDDEKVHEAETESKRDKGKWMKREAEIEDSTRQVGFCVDGLEATVRVEMR
ncbi:tubulin-specific chaperone-like protein E [Calycina marina]|uniref:Tubulin-specific chaperone-like protein E n=1 Tax=Calycina marina TaxID=1763456 RepID=A0A9P7YY98_9HELO|nr:tubulin-specific chaperone-like protein E [Calycina marina]